MNLTTHRAAASVWDRRGWDGTPEQLTMTRWMIGVGGAALAIQGLRQRSVFGSMLSGIGGTLAWWALTGQGDMAAGQHRVRQLFSAVMGNRSEPIDDASADSFPASDAPAWTATVGTGMSQRMRAR